MSIQEAPALEEDALDSDEVEAQPLKDIYECPLPGCVITGRTVGGMRRHLTKIHNVPGREYALEPRTNITYGATVYGPQEEKVRVLFYPSGGIRVRIIDAAPMAITEAHLRGEANVIIKLDPTR